MNINLRNVTQLNFYQFQPVTRQIRKPKVMLFLEFLYVHLTLYVPAFGHNVSVTKMVYRRRRSIWAKNLFNKFRSLIRYKDDISNATDFIF